MKQTENGKETQSLSPFRKKLIEIGICTAIVVLAILITIAVALSGGQDQDPDQTTTQTAGQETNATDAQTLPPTTEAAPWRDAVVNGVKWTDGLTLGIDVSRYQGTIDWEKAAADGVDFAMIRVGYRTLDTGVILPDSTAQYNMQEAQKYGVKLGAYFFSTAITPEEAAEEANWAADFIAKYQITYPVAFNYEGFNDPENRQYGLTKAQRTDIALAFLETIGDRGYQPMFYASMSELQAEAQWETSRIGTVYPVWVAQYPAVPYPMTESSDYLGSHVMWQHSTEGMVDGIFGNVDMNVAYFDYDGVAQPQDPEPPEEVYPDVLAHMNFTEVHEEVTAKIETNLRDIPSQGGNSHVMYLLKNGEVAIRTGISDTGWSRLTLNGKTYYAISNYLTTDLSYQPPQEEDDGIKTPFTVVSDQVTAKDVVNLRTLPSVTHEDSKVVAQLTKGEVITRTGINTDVGWSRVEYNGQVLYCISSYLTVIE